MHRFTHLAGIFALFPGVLPAATQDGDGTVRIDGELKQWHKVTLTMDGPFARETDADPNPFTDYLLTVRFAHESGGRDFKVPGYFAADGNAANSSATEGRKWRAHFAPDRTGEWTYEVSLLHGKSAIHPEKGGGRVSPVSPLHGRIGRFRIEASDKTLPDFRCRGRLSYVGQRYLRFEGDQSDFIKAGADAPETLLAYGDFDGTAALKKKIPLKSWKPHIKDWKPGDPTWGDGKGKGLIGALNYLSSKGCNAFSFIPCNVDGDGSNVWPFVAPREKLHYDCSKLDQWGVIFDHATNRGLYLHFKLQETETDDKVPASLDGGDLGIERKLYCRELIARFGHNLALNWNLGEENTQSTRQQLEMADYIRETDPYDHHVVIHTFPDRQDAVYNPLLGKQGFTGASLQNSNVLDCHHQVVKWTDRSREAGRPWVVAVDETGNASFGIPPDPDWPGMTKNAKGPSIHDIRKYALWGTLMAGGGGVEYYFGYRHPQNDLLADDWRSRDQSWNYARIALDFIRTQKLPVGEMRCRDDMVGNPEHDNSRYCLAKENGPYLIYLPDGGEAEVAIPERDHSIKWFNPRTGELGKSEPLRSRKLTAPDKDDWVALIR